MTALPRGATLRRDAGLYGFERALRRGGLQPVAGVDEAGRGACAGLGEACRRRARADEAGGMCAGT